MRNSQRSGEEEKERLGNPNLVGKMVILTEQVEVRQ